MTLTPDQVTQYEQRLRTEIMERECVLAALGVFHDYASKGQSQKSLEFGPLVSALIPAPAETKAEPVGALPPPALAPPAPIKRERPKNPELEAIRRGHFWTTDVVRWAIRQMHDHYSVTDLDACLKREGYNLGSAAISVILTRMKNRGEILELTKGRGRRASVFMNFVSPTPSDTERNGRVENATA